MVRAELPKPSVGRYPYHVVVHRIQLACLATPLAIAERASHGPIAAGPTGRPLGADRKCARGLGAEKLAVNIIARGSVRGQLVGLIDLPKRRRRWPRDHTRPVEAELGQK